MLCAKLKNLKPGFKSVLHEIIDRLFVRIKMWSCINSIHSLCSFCLKHSQRCLYIIASVIYAGQDMRMKIYHLRLPSC
jgi:hypothetical protein